MVNAPLRQRGLTYLAVLLAVALMGAALAATGIVWRAAWQRDAERELLFVGEQFRRAIRLYYERTPGPAKLYPPSLEALLQDPRQPRPVRYLRRIYGDPLSGGREWGLVMAPQGGVMGVYSLSAEAPMKKAGFPAVEEDFAGAARYSDWRFVYLPPAPLPGGAEQAGEAAPVPPPPEPR